MPVIIFQWQHDFIYLICQYSFLEKDHFYKKSEIKGIEKNSAQPEAAVYHLFEGANKEFFDEVFDPKNQFCFKFTLKKTTSTRNFLLTARQSNNFYKFGSNFRGVPR